MTSGVKVVPPTVLAARLRDLRETAGLTQTDLAHEFRTGPNRISDWETGVREPTLMCLRRYAAYFKVSLSGLLDGVK